MKKVIILLLLLVVTIFANTITVAVSANVSYAIVDLKKEFNKLYPNIKVRVILGGSGKLTAQIKNGAPYQLFMSANMNYPLALYKDGLAISKPLVYAEGSLAYLSNHAQDFTKGMFLLNSKNIHKIAVANPKTAPYGKATFEAMKNSGVFDSVKNKFVYGESISQTLSYAITATDIGFIAKSALFTPKMSRYKKGINWEDVNPKLYTPISQGMVILKNGTNNQDVTKFYNFILSDKAKKILTEFGYKIP